MKKFYSEKISFMLEDIKSNTKTVGSITEFQDVNKISYTEKRSV